jgi:hypothetical protein
MTLQGCSSGFSGSNRRNPARRKWLICLGRSHAGRVCPVLPVYPVFPGSIDQMPESTTTIIICRNIYALWVVFPSHSIQHAPMYRRNRRNRRNPRERTGGPQGKGRALALAALTTQRRKIQLARCEGRQDRRNPRLSRRASDAIRCSYAKNVSVARLLAFSPRFR